VAQEFHLRLITQRAGGGDPIIRDRSVAGGEATIGRAETSDIVLADLSIDLDHARMRFSGPGRVRIESLAGQTFRVGDRDVQGADLDVSTRPEVTFGSYTLAFGEAPEGDALVIVTREEDARHLSPSDFSLKAKVFGRRRMAWMLGGGVLLICLLIPMIAAITGASFLIHPERQWSAGPLSKSHAFLQNDCKSCHANAFVAVRDTSCQSCHDAGQPAKAMARAQELDSPFRPLLVADHAPREKLSDGTPPPSGLGAIGFYAQTLLGHPTDRCASCHIEHTKAGKGGDPEAPLNDKPRLTVVHDCQSCHTDLSSRLKTTTLLNAPDKAYPSFAHPNFKATIVTEAGPAPKLQRAALTGAAAPKERNGLIFPHDRHLDPYGGVARQAIDLGKSRGYGAPLECASCHRPDGKDGKTFKPVEMERDCGTCHSLAFVREGGDLKYLPHGELQRVIDTLSGRTLIAPGERVRPRTLRATIYSARGASAYRAAFSPGGTCYDCHTITWEGDTVKMAPVSLTQRYLPKGGFDHSVPEHGGPGRPKAGGFKCADCHAAKTSGQTADVLIPDIAKCATCHGKEETKIAAASDANCTTCHAFHKPGQATPAPGHPPLKALQWTKVASR
jgi:hypothetical protein